MALDDRDPSTLTDEELDNVLAGNEPEDLDAPAPTEEEEEPEAIEGEEEGEDPAPEETQEEEEKPPSRREALRIQQLIEKMKSPQQEKPTPVNPAHLNYEDELDAEPETIKRLEADRKAAEEAAYSRVTEEVRASEWRTTLNYDAPQVEQKYEVLNPKHENFHEAVADSLTNWYLSTTQYDANTGKVGNPNIRWTDFVDGVMELAEEIASSKVQTATKNITKQAARTAIRPDGSSSKRLNLNQAPESMSDEELDAIIAQAIPKR